MPSIRPIRLSLSNAFLLLGERPVLVDTGSPGEQHKIARAVESAGVDLDEIALILLTHGHRDHAGSAVALREMTGAPIAMHPADGAMVERGHMGRMTPVRARHRSWEPFLNRPFPAFTADLPLVARQPLDAYGLDAQVIETPGHSAGSVSLLLPGGAALVGDLVIGGFLGGLLKRRRPRLPYFAEDLALLKDSLKDLVGLAPGRWWLGHGGPVEAAEVARRLL